MAKKKEEKKIKEKKVKENFESNAWSVLCLAGVFMIMFSAILAFLSSGFEDVRLIMVSDLVLLVGFILMFFGGYIYFFQLGNPFKKSFASLKFLKIPALIIVGVFVIFALLGFFIMPPDFIIQEILKSIQELLLRTEGMSTIELISFIFSNNLQVSFFGFVFGVFIGFISVLIALFNGYFLGFVSGLVVSNENVFALWRLLPHGVFELTAVVISLALGVKFGSFIFQKNIAESFKNYFWNGLRIFLFIVTPLLLLAAVIEGLLIGLM